MQQIVSVDSKSPKRSPFGAQMGGPLKKGSFYPISVGSEKGSKVEALDGIRIYSDADEMV